jgi:hypothetical protein
MGRNDSVADWVLNPTLSLARFAARLVRFFLYPRAPVLSPGRSFFCLCSPILLTLNVAARGRDRVPVIL